MLLGHTLTFRSLGSNREPGMQYSFQDSIIRKNLTSIKCFKVINSMIEGFSSYASVYTWQ